jgi:hypothetical protein
MVKTTRMTHSRRSESCAAEVGLHGGHSERGEAMAEIATIYIALLNEGTDVWKPVTAEHLSGGRDPAFGTMRDVRCWGAKQT